MTAADPSLRRLSYPLRPGPFSEPSDLYLLPLSAISTSGTGSVLRECNALRAAGTGVVETSPGVEVGWVGGVAVACAGVEVAAGGVGERSGGPTPGLGARVGVGVGTGQVAGDSASPATVAGVGGGTASHAVCPKDSATARSRRDSNLACKLRFLVLNTTVTSEPLLGATPNSQAKDA